MDGGNAKHKLDDCQNDDNEVDQTKPKRDDAKEEDEEDEDDDCDDDDDCDEDDDIE
jgi:hypothetical protein